MALGFSPRGASAPPIPRETHVCHLAALGQPAPGAPLPLEQLRKVASAGLCVLHAYVIMPNHVHVLWTAQVALAELIRQVKGPTACSANRVLGRAGEPFWQPEYFDRIVRSEEEFLRVFRYIERNPVKAALVARAEDFLWSSAYDRTGLKPGAV